MLFNGKGYVKEFGMSARDQLAMHKYARRAFRGTDTFTFVPDLWGTWMDPFYWQKDYFSDGAALVVDVRAKVYDPAPSMPLVLVSDGWKFVLPFPSG